MTDRRPAATTELDDPDARQQSTETQVGIYVYCIIESIKPQTFGKIGIGGRGDEIYTVPYKDLAAVVSRTPLVVYDPTRENVLAHKQVQDAVIEQNFTPVPMSFGTLFKSEESVIELLDDTYETLKDVLQKMKDKLEYGLTVNWNREEVLAELERDHEDIRRLKEQIAGNQQGSTYFARMQLGRLVEQALQEKSEAYMREIYDQLRDSAIASRANKTIGDRMIMNASFLVERDKAQVFREKVGELVERYEGKLTFRESGPWAPYSFVTIRLHLERSALV